MKTECQPFFEDYLGGVSGRAKRTRTGVIAPDGERYRNQGEYTAKLKRDANPLYNIAKCKDFYSLLRVQIGSTQMWIEVTGKRCKMCRAMPFDTQESMHDRMTAVGHDLNNEARQSLLQCFAKELG